MRDGLRRIGNLDLLRGGQARARLGQPRPGLCADRAAPGSDEVVCSGDLSTCLRRDLRERLLGSQRLGLSIPRCLQHLVNLPVRLLECVQRRERALLGGIQESAGRRDLLRRAGSHAGQTPIGIGKCARGSDVGLELGDDALRGRCSLPKVPCQRVDRVLQLQCLGYSILGAANRDRCLCCLAGSEVLPGFGERSVSEGDALADLLGVVSNGRNGVRVKRCLEVRERAFSAGYAG